MTELLCIETHPKRVVVAGNYYPLLGTRKSPCCGMDQVNIGILADNILHIPVGDPLKCSACGGIRQKTKEDNYWWLRSSRFAQIGTEDECEQYREKVLIENQPSGAK